jgi:alkaline phosphatase
VKSFLLVFTDSEYWKMGAQNTLRQKLARRLLTGRAKNVILFLGDGLSIPTLAAARAYLGQSQGHTGEESILSFEAFPHTGLSKVKGLNERNTKILVSRGRIHEECTSSF